MRSDRYITGTLAICTLPVALACYSSEGEVSKCIIMTIELGTHRRGNRVIVDGIVACFDGRDGFADVRTSAQAHHLAWRRREARRRGVSGGAWRDEATKGGGER